MAETPDAPGAIWVASDLAPDGTYVTAIHYSGDRSRILDRAAALAYAAEIHRAAVCAEHDAAIIRQLTSLGLPMEAGGHTVRALRADRPPLDDAATAPLRLVPGVSARTGAGFLDLYVDGKQVGQWDPVDARGHASYILDALAAADLDAAYHRYLISDHGLDADSAKAIIGGLAAHLAGDDR
ncbi:hypothetical protein [Planobispora rosea]|uniref:hypothetical protein n=1 Tax=Planobispora rosea TaxID=35762 RepID=UPI00083B5801|nr:hypothetical protein [Planobispora rosea]